MRRAGFALAIVAATAVAAGTAVYGQSKESQDQQFVHEAAIINMTEIELGKLAADKGAHAKVKEFGNRMVNDHGRVFDELKALAGGKNMALPSELGAKQKMLRDQLAGLSGAAFDRSYMDEMVKGHQKAVAEFMKESTMGSDAELKAWAAKTLPGVESHHRMAQEIQKEVGAVKTSASAVR